MIAPQMLTRSIVALSLSAASVPALAKVAPIQIEKQGSFHVGGKVLASPDGRETLHCDHGYVSYQIPVKARKIALFLWHSSSAHVWEQRWDGGEGYQSILLRHGYATYLWDGPRVGRANMGCVDYEYKAESGRDQRNWVAWRFGPSQNSWYPGVQFPTTSKDAYEQAMSARYQEFDFAENAHLEASAGAKAIDQIGPSVALTNSAGGWRAMLAALTANQIKGIVAYETAAFVFPDGEGPSGPETGFGPTHVPMSEFMKLTKIPIELVFGDYTQEVHSWRRHVEDAKTFVSIINRLGGNAEILMLPDAGMRGNTHIPFADLNNAQVAEQLFLFLRKNKLDGR